MRHIGLRIAFALQNLAIKIDRIGWLMECRVVGSLPGPDATDTGERPDWWREND